jgi:hypothetical protein
VTELARALVDQLGPDGLADLAARLAPYLSAAPAAEWMDAKAAARHLGMSVASLHQLTRRRAVPFVQDNPGTKCWFRRSELDEWRCK